jgi:F-type H+-transporting ATPase subunit delta
MGDRTAARRYAKAFIALATETDSVEALAIELDRVEAACLTNDRELYLALCNPGFTLEERVAVVGAVAKQIKLSTHTTNLLKLLIEKQRFASVFDIVELFRERADALAGRVRVQVTTADAMSKKLEAEVKSSISTLTGKEVLLETSIDPSLIGGLVARVGDTVYDASIKARLSDLKHRLIHAQAPVEA